MDSAYIEYHVDVMKTAHSLAVGGLVVIKNLLKIY